MLRAQGFRVGVEGLGAQGLGFGIGCRKVNKGSVWLCHKSQRRYKAYPARLRDRERGHTPFYVTRSGLDIADQTANAHIEVDDALTVRKAYLILWSHNWRLACFQNKLLPDAVETEGQNPTHTEHSKRLGPIAAVGAYQSELRELPMQLRSMPVKLRLIVCATSLKCLSNSAMSGTWLLEP